MLLSPLIVCFSFPFFLLFPYLLQGQLLVATGAVPSRTLHKHKQEAAAMGKASFYLAWVMDEDTSERAHGVTIDVAQKKFTTPTKEVTVLDSPGHADFVPRMIGEIPFG
jgi:elongation factor 1 alpha-like protein